MKKYIAIFLCLVGLAMAAGCTDWQQGAAEGLKMGFKMGQSYANALGGVNVTGFNAQVDIYNAWVRSNFGEDPNLLMSKMEAPVDLSKPYILANNTTGGGIVHAIDGSTVNGPSYTTNDVNLLPKGIDLTKATTSNPWQQGGAEYLGGV